MRTPTLSCCCLLLAALAAQAADAPKSRTFEFTYSATVTGLKPGEDVRAWLPVPPNLPEQDVKVLTPLPPGSRISKEAKHGNRVLCYDGKANKDGAFPLEMTYRVTRREVLGKGGKLDLDM